MSALSIGVSFVLGAAVGSFLNVVIHRVPRNISVVRPSSRCEACGTRIREWDNIPILSYFLLRGRCRACGAAFSGLYAAVEALTSTLWVLIAMWFGPTEAAAFVAVFGSVLIALSVIDLRVRRLPNSIVLPGMVASAVWIGAVAIGQGDFAIIARALASAAVLFAIYLLIALASGGMGMGDVKLAGLIGLLTGRFGWEVAALATFAAFFIGGLVAMGLLVTRRAARKTAVPFGPSMAIGALVALFWGPAPVRAWLGG